MANIELRRNKPSHIINDNDVIKFKDRTGETYIVCFEWDGDMAESPREYVQNSPYDSTIMAVWWGDYKLGDNIGKKSPEEFWQGLVLEHVSSEEAFQKLKNGNLKSASIKPNAENPELWDIYEAQEYLEYEGIPADAVLDWIYDDLSISDCQMLLEPYLEWLPLWIYEHSGLTMSCGSRSYPYNDRFDSGAAGWIVCLKETVEGWRGPDIGWRDIAVDAMKSEVEVYDMWLRGECYGFKLYSVGDNEDAEDVDDWIEEDSCWGFYGYDIFENGMLDYISGLEEALTNGKYETGTTQTVTYSYTKFNFEK